LKAAFSESEGNNTVDCVSGPTAFLPRLKPWASARTTGELDTSGSAFYLAAWESDDPEVVRDHLDRISSIAEELIDVLKDGA